MSDVAIPFHRRDDCLRFVQYDGRIITLERHEKGYPYRVHDEHDRIVWATDELDVAEQVFEGEERRIREGELCQRS